MCIRDRLYTALESDAELHCAISEALFRYHDRLSTRRRRARNAVKYTALFMSCNVLDFLISNWPLNLVQYLLS